jgi:hypothetical protein
MDHESRINTFEKAQQSSIDIVYADHSEANLPRVAEAVLASNGDIIAIEKVREGSFAMGTSKEKADLSARMTDFISSKNSINESAADYFRTNEPFFTALLDGLKGSDKLITLIDMGTDDPGYYLFRKTRQLKLDILTLRNSLHHENDVKRQRQIDDLTLDYHIAFAQQLEYREQLMLNQLTQFSKNYPGKKITAMMGASHTWVSHHIPDTMSMSRIFVPAEEDAQTYPRSVKMRYDYDFDSRALRFSLDKLKLSILDENGNLKTNLNSQG